VTEDLWFTADSPFLLSSESDCFGLHLYRLFLSWWATRMEKFIRGGYPIYGFGLALNLTAYANRLCSDTLLFIERLFISTTSG
jgi:hypothetical protein